jgi:acetyl esterase/lipase
MRTRLIVEMVMKHLILAPRVVALWVLFVFASGGQISQTPTSVPDWQPSPGHTQIPIWPGVVPDAKSGAKSAAETVAQPAARPEFTTTDDSLIAGKRVLAVSNVTRPTMTVYSPTGKNTGVAVVVFPGGGYQILAIDLEGTEVCDWLTSKGITCVLLKYRVPNSGMHWDERCKCQLAPKAPTALEDAQRTVGLVRFHAAEWHIDPHKIGVLGFSAGGHLVAGISTHFAHRLYPVVDAADKESCRPDFAVALYSGHLWIDGKKFELNPDIGTNVTSQTPPTFLLQAEDDYVDNVNQSLVCLAVPLTEML